MIAWSKLNKTDIPTLILSDWEALLNDRSKKEEAYQRFLSNHSGFFFPKVMDFREQVVIAKLKFGTDYISDFVLCDNQRSYGFQYTLIEIESPHTSAFTKGGKFSARLNGALQQINDWQRWIAKNKDSAKKIFPSKQFALTNEGNFRYIIVLGRRADHEPYQDQLTFYHQKHGIEVRSFDYLTDVLKSRRFLSFTNISHDIVAPTDDQNNEFTNPFSIAYSDRKWRAMVNNSSFSYSHMIGNNIGILLANRSYNQTRLADFNSKLTALGNTIDASEYNIIK